jgi:hypothetical protein
MYYKKIVPIQILNIYASEFIGEFSFTLGDFSSRQFEIEFYDNEGNPLLLRKGNIFGLPINTNLTQNINPHTFDYNSQDAKKMFDIQDKIIFDKIKDIFGLTYYDDTFEKKDNRVFSYKTYFNAVKPENINKSYPLNSY